MSTDGPGEHGRTHARTRGAAKDAGGTGGIGS
jgi:hypothetical protein